MRKGSNAEANGRRLILGYDGGCFTCSGLASRIEERLEGKIEVRSLRDPEVREWREQALGNDAPWAPTLFEIKGAEVRAWIGWRLAANLSRFLGLAASWQVMQELGEVSKELHALEVGETRSRRIVTRGRFLKGLSGAALAASSGILMPSLVTAQEEDPNTSTGTAEQQRRAKVIVRNSNQFRSLFNFQSKVGASFDWSDAVVKVKQGRLAVVRVISDHSERAVVAVFTISFAQERVRFYQAIILGRVEGKQAIKLTRWVNGRTPRDYHQAYFGKDWVIDQDNRLLSVEEYKAAADEYRQRNNSYELSQDGNYECKYNTLNACGAYAGVYCGVLAVGLIATAAGAPLGIAVAVSCAAGAVIACPNISESSCANNAGSPSGIQEQPPSYYCK